MLKLSDFQAQVSPQFPRSPRTARSSSSRRGGAVGVHMWLKFVLLAQRGFSPRYISFLLSSNQKPSFWSYVEDPLLNQLWLRVFFFHPLNWFPVLSDSKQLYTTLFVYHELQKHFFLGGSSRKFRIGVCHGRS